MRFLPRQDCKTKESNLQKYENLMGNKCELNKRVQVIKSAGYISKEVKKCTAL
jgi:hypothetical protein